MLKKQASLRFESPRGDQAVYAAQDLMTFVLAKKEAYAAEGDKRKGGKFFGNGLAVAGTPPLGLEAHLARAGAARTCGTCIATDQG